MFTPNNLKNLHVAISAITGQPRIIQIKNIKYPSFCDKYKNIPEDEWISAILNYFEMTVAKIIPPKKYHAPTLKAHIEDTEIGKGIFALGGKFDSWEDLEDQAKMFLLQVQIYKQNKKELKIEK